MSFPIVYFMACNEFYRYTYKSAAIDEDNDEIAYFMISGEGFDTGKPMDMNIFVEDKYVGMGLAKKLIQNMVYNLKEHYPNIRKDQLLFIDTDASNGFWEHIGMKNNRYYDGNRDVEGRGYEKHITYQSLCAVGHT